MHAGTRRLNVMDINGLLTAFMERGKNIGSRMTSLIITGSQKDGLVKTGFFSPVLQANVS